MFEMRCISKYLQEQFNTVYDGARALFCSLQSNVPGTFFNATHQLKVIAIGISEANPLAESIDCCFPLHLQVFFPKKQKIRFKELFPSTHFYIGLYSRICCFIQ